MSAQTSLISYCTNVSDLTNSNTLRHCRDNEFKGGGGGGEIAERIKIPHHHHHFPVSTNISNF